MLKRCSATGFVLGLGVLILTAAIPASGYLYKKPSGHDCGRAGTVGGFGGPRPSNVAANAVPQIHTFIDRGTITCVKAERVMSSFEKSFTKPGATSKGISPSGWKCAFSTSLKGQSCTSANHVVISNGIVYVTPR